MTVVVIMMMTMMMTMMMAMMQARFSRASACGYDCDSVPTMMLMTVMLAMMTIILAWDYYD